MDQISTPQNLQKDGIQIIENRLDEMAEIMTGDSVQEIVHKLLQGMKDVIVKKGRDYSGEEHTWANFEWCADVGMMDVPVVFLALMGTKFARLASLLTSKGTPNFESIDDTWLDLANYIVLFMAYQEYIKQNGGEKYQPLAFPIHITEL